MSEFVPGLDRAICKNCGGWYTSHWRDFMGAPPDNSWCINFEIGNIVREGSNPRGKEDLKKNGTT